MSIDFMCGWEPFKNASGYILGVTKGTDDDDVMLAVDFAHEGLPSVCRIFKSDDQCLYWTLGEEDELIARIREASRLAAEDVCQSARSFNATVLLQGGIR
jgi:hypothetical protein